MKIVLTLFLLAFASLSHAQGLRLFSLGALSDGEDWQADQAKMAADPVTQEWWALCMPCQRPLDSAKDGEWWAPMEEVFFHE